MTLLAVQDFKVADNEKDVLLSAADILDRQPHLAKHLFVDSDGCVCTVGAIQLAAGSRGSNGRSTLSTCYGLDWRAENLLVSLLGQDVVSWSDNPRRTTKSAARAIRKLVKE